ncbi:hypothetical protein GCM10009836_42460 [Pseudonocardia ailaonensis]|uniref:DUF5709 domain-containing protein n=1 Tax=Pseudonocardia ailaonensis TaxID=367279 RepID=A0ABN2N9H5_9PSEU
MRRAPNGAPDAVFGTPRRGYVPDMTHPEGPQETEEAVDRAEEKVLGHTVDQDRDDGGDAETEERSGSEPTD